MTMTTMMTNGDQMVSWWWKNIHLQPQLAQVTRKSTARYL